MSETIRWGILSTGNIARQFARGLEALPDAELVAVGSRAQESADAFGDEFDVPHRHASYKALANDSEVDVIYIGTPHPYHLENTLLCLDAGKAVLCEKPFAINVTEAKAMVDLARERGVFLMEAMWSRFLPAIVKVRELLDEGVLGEIRMFTGDFGFNARPNPEHRLFNPAMGGGALLDVGIYPISFASLIFGEPESIVSMAHIGETGVDEEASILLGYRDGQTANCYTAIRLNTPNAASIIGREGRIDIHPRFWYATDFTLHLNGKEPVEYHLPYEGNGYNYEAIEVGNCLREHKLESSVIPLDETLQIMQTLDDIRAQWGLKYPME